MTLLQEVESKIYSLPIRERGRIAHNLLASIDNEAEESEKYEKEIQRRVKLVKSGKVIGIPADEVFAKLEAKYAK